MDKKFKKGKKRNYEAQTYKTPLTPYELTVM